MSSNDISGERLREAIFALNAARDHERQQRQTAQTMLSGLKILNTLKHTEEVFSELINIIRELLPFDDAFLAVDTGQGQLHVVSSTNSTFFDAVWTIEQSFSKVLNGKTLGSFNVVMVPEWRCQPSAVLARIVSALHVPVRTAKQRGMLVCTHSEKGFFKKEHIAILENFAPLISQALMNVEYIEAVESAVNVRTRELKESQNILLTAIEHVPGGFLLIDKEGKIALYNKRLKEIYPKQTDLIFIGAQFEDFLRAGTKRGVYHKAQGRIDQWVIERLQKYRKREVSYEEWLSDGRWIKVSIQEAPNGSRVGIYLDITAVKVAQEVAETANRTKNAVLNNVADAIVTIDEAGVIQSANPATERIFGLPLDGIVGRNVSILMPSDIGVRHDGFLKAYAETGRSHIIGVGRELIGKRADGSLFPLELSISEVTLDDRTLYTGILRDITRRKAVEQSLRESEQKARTLSLVADRTDNAVIITDANGRIEWVNGGFERISGFKLDEIIGLKPGVFLQGEETSPEQITYMSGKISSGEPFTAEVVNYTKDKVPYWVQIDAQPIYGTDGVLEHYIAIERDVTGIKQRETELEDAKQRAEEGSATKSRFLAVVSHEMRTPVNAINAVLQEIRYATADSRVTELASVALSSSDLLRYMIEDVIDVTRLETDKLAFNHTSFNVAVVADEAVSLLSDRAKDKQILLNLSTQKLVHPLIECDRYRLKQVMINLVSNAIKFTDSGFVNVICRSVATDTKHAQIIFEVHDTGQGIDKNNLENIFERFYQANIGDGLGLGLAISKDIVNRLGGIVTVKSRKGFGSTFTVDIPVKIAEKADLQANDRVAGKPLDGLHLLIAEDNSTNQYVIKMIVHRLGGKAAFAGNGKVAVEMAQRGRYDLILMDINMPVTDGIEAFKELRYQTQGDHPPVIALTANALPEQLDAYLRQGMAGCVTKPIQEVELIRTILCVLGRPELIGVVEHSKTRTVPALNVRQKAAVESLLASMDED